MGYVGLEALIERGMVALKVAVDESMAELEPNVRSEIPVLAEPTRERFPGELRDSLYSTDAKITGRTVKAKISVGEFLDYAVIVHEKWPNNGTKYLERPVLEHIPAHLERIREAAKKAY